MRPALTWSWCGVCVLLLGIPRPAVAQQEPASAQSALAGSMVFGSKGCVRCHAVNGVGGDVGPDLGRSRRVRTFYDFASAVWNHLPGMVSRMRQLEVPLPRLAPWEVEDLTAFLFTVDFFGARGDAERGRRVFAEKRCVRCHQVRGVGGVIGPSLDVLSSGSPVEVAAAMWNHGPMMARTMEAWGIARPSVSSADLTDLVAYLRGADPAPPDRPLYLLPGRPDRGRTQFVEKSCSRCHSVAGVGAGGVGPDLAGRRRDWDLLQFAAAMWNKAPRMTAAMREQGIAVPELRPEELADLLAYLASVQYFEQAGDAARGGRLVWTKGCLDCHSLRRQGARTAGDLAQARGLTSASAVVAAMWNHALVLEEAPRRAAWPRFNGAEMADLVAFFTERAPAR